MQHKKQNCGLIIYICSRFRAIFKRPLKQNQCQVLRKKNSHIHGLCTCSGYSPGPKGLKDK